MSSLLNIGLTGLYAAQAQLSTTSHNVANASTPGYHRQTVQQSTSTPLLRGGSFFGQGTAVDSVQRTYNQYLENQVMLSDNRRAEYAAYSMQVNQIDNLLADPSVGLSPALSEFFAAMQNVSANPTNIASRQALLSTGEALVARFQALDSRLSEIRQGVDADIEATVTSINSYAREIADLNQRIMDSRARSGGTAANDLLDLRDQAVAQLNQLVRVSTVPQDDGTISVFIGSGQRLVLGDDAARLGTAPGAGENGGLGITLIARDGTASPLSETLLTGGSIGGTLAFRREALDTVQRDLGLIATTLATAFNTQHKLGVDLDGMLGTDFFKPAAVSVESSAATIEIDPGAIGELTASSYSLAISGTTYTLTNLTTGASRTLGEGETFEGLKLTSALGADGTYLVEPTRYAAGRLAMGIADPRKVAAAGPVAVAAAGTNGGTARVGDIRVASTEGMVSGASTTPDFTAVGLSWSGGTLSVPAGYVLASGNPPVADNAYDPATEGNGKTFTLTAPEGYSLTFSLAGTPADGDSFTFGPNTGGIADNRNAVLLGSLQTDKLMFDAGGRPTATLNNAYAQLVSKVGNKAREMQAGEKAQDALLAQAEAARDSVSGVNLDEEAANLLRFQQAYQASARVMAVAQTLFDEMLAIGR
ncbi:flagellar hook-associated protein FlgK [Thauera sinica]|uniref:Flagellar hook-associated protein 1 n=1 Tax=Thauera sinica TaxID=2665146 RepID=A0ABW1AP87_9RHOO|nr:flagellar hook-associated protein FlgK [Thauera sp. K11]ATE59414.1 flagellar hook-associated protein FlgK [Thauera sp. K11]